MFPQPFKIGGVDDGIQQLLPDAAIPPAAKASIGYSSSLRNRVGGRSSQGAPRYAGSRTPRSETGGCPGPAALSSLRPREKGLPCPTPHNHALPVVYHHNTGVYRGVSTALANNPNIERSTAFDWLSNQTRFCGKAQAQFPALHTPFTPPPFFLQ